ncbi:hypothetical protein MVEN_00228200 [Mycena venus]|uniref:DUF6533 domain-containing protein n=1 Tax=Mycena venus TaxID=2733690 RepID=A0A8H6Z133_9AGAR|nr:hypothetical protein MVEN_00228200 [Mycena venus]
MSSGPFGVEVDVEVLSDLETTRLVSAVGLVILLYDHLLSLPDEVQFIWPAAWTSSKILFLGMRYCVPLVMIVHTIQLSGLANVFLADDGWFFLRLWVLWDRGRAFIVGTLSIFFLSNISMLVITVIGILRMIPGIHFQPFLQICLFETTPHALRVLWLPGLTFEFIMILAMGWKIFMHPPTFITLLHDGYLYFLFLFGLNLLNTAIVLSARPSLLFVTVFFMWCFYDDGHMPHDSQSSAF